MGKHNAIQNVSINHKRQDSRFKEGIFIQEGSKFEEKENSRDAAAFSQDGGKFTHTKRGKKGIETTQNRVKCWEKRKVSALTRSTYASFAGHFPCLWGKI